MGRIAGIWICLLAMGVFVAPMPVLHVCEIDVPHIGYFQFRGAEASNTHTCAHHDHDHDEHAPPLIDEHDRDEAVYWLTLAPQVDKAKVTGHTGFSSLLSAGSQPACAPGGIGIRGPPRSRLSLFCTLRI